MDGQLFIEKIQRIYETPGGKSAAAVVVQKLGAEPFVGDILDPSYINKSGGRNILVEDLKLWIQESNPDIEQSNRMLEEILMQPTKENFLLLFGETLGTTTAFLVPEGYSPVYIAKLHPDTVKEFEKFESQGLIEIITNKSDVRLNSLRPDQQIFSDKKRELGTRYLCAIQLNYFK
jgi:hypothetical protein